jgi:hypothetical protein
VPRSWPSLANPNPHEHSALDFYPQDSAPLPSSETFLVPRMERVKQAISGPTRAPIAASSHDIPGDGQNVYIWADAARDWEEMANDVGPFFHFVITGQLEVGGA